MDFILNGQGHGNVAGTLMAHDFDIGALRPFVDDYGRSFICVNAGTPKEQVIQTNASGFLRRDDWILLDETLIKVAKERLAAVADLRSRGLVFNIPNGISKAVLQHERVSDITGAQIDMDGLAESQGDRPYFDLVNLPLPIIHKDFQFSARQIQISRNGGSPLDTTTAELAARRVAEEAEKLLLGTSGSYSYGGGTIYGLTNFPSRMTKSLNDPTDLGWVPADTVQDVLEMRLQAQQAFHYGPYQLYTSLAWDTYLDDDYSAAKGDLTLRERLMKITGIQGIKSLDYLGSGYTMLLVQTTSDVIREVIGMDISTVQWESHGGMQLNFKVMCIMVPQLRTDINGKTGIVHGSV